MSLIKQHFNEAYSVLEQFLSDDSNFEKIEEAGAIMVDAIAKGGKILTCGNGGSMCDAMHFAEEMTGRYRENRKALPAISLSDASHISCTGNDYGFDYIFSRQVDAIGSENDVLLAISTSGNSVNIINAALSAKNKGMKIVALTGKTGGKLPDYSNVNILVPHKGWSDRIQEIHIKVIHSLIDYIETKTLKKK